MSTNLQEWPEPVVRVQALSESGLTFIPDRYVKPETDRPAVVATDDGVNVPIIDFSCLQSENEKLRKETRRKLKEACNEWGFFQAVNHGVSADLMDRAREQWRGFFHLPIETKQKYANSPKTYEGYGSRLGIEKGAILDWSDYYYLHYLPLCLKDLKKWPASPPNFRETIDEYGEELVKLSKRIMKVLSVNLGLEEKQLQNAFGGEDDFAACLRVNFYPKCPQPNLTLGLSPHSDPGGLTLLLPDLEVPGLQVKKDGRWITVKPARHAFIVNVGDQVQVLSNTQYKSVEHRVIVNSNQERVSLAFFYNPRSDIPIEPLAELVSPGEPALYPPMTFDQYRLFIRLKGPKGKYQVDSMQSPR